MGSISALGTLAGAVSAEASLSGKLSSGGGLSGSISIALAYDGSYTIVPDAFETQTLPTRNRILSEDVVVREVPFYEAGNDSDGMTAYIGKDVENGL